MPRIPKSYIEGVLYYITSRGDNNEVIFKDDADFRAYLRLVKKYKEKYGFKLFAFILMANHLHLLLELKEGLTVPNILHDIHSSYTKYFNAKYQRKGHVFQERYSMIVAEKPAYLLALTAYIHLNPKAQSPAREFREYGYSSYVWHKEHDGASLEGLDMKEEIDEINARVAAIPLDSYAAYTESMDQVKIEALQKEIGSKSLLGSEKFIEKINDFLASNKKVTEEVPAVQPQRPSARKLMTGVGVVFLALIGLILIFRKENLGIKKTLEQKFQQKEIEFSERLAKEKVFIKKDLQEKYKADLVSYQALSKRLEIEKQRRAELEAKTGGEK